MSVPFPDRWSLVWVSSYRRGAARYGGDCFHDMRVEPDLVRDCLRLGVAERTLPGVRPHLWMVSNTRVSR